MRQTCQVMDEQESVLVSKGNQWPTRMHHLAVSQWNHTQNTTQHVRYTHQNVSQC
eukprot:m.370659 g.370659  ORF g.370659 m.370659 type:complete len:55 (-) comp54935_c0_seq1:17-181(-)